MGPVSYRIDNIVARKLLPRIGKRLSNCWLFSLARDVLCSKDIINCFKPLKNKKSKMKNSTGTIGSINLSEISFQLASSISQKLKN